MILNILLERQFLLTTVRSQLFCWHLMTNLENSSADTLQLEIFSSWILSQLLSIPSTVRIPMGILRKLCIFDMLYYDLFLPNTTWETPIRDRNANGVEVFHRIQLENIEEICVINEGCEVSVHVYLPQVQGSCQDTSQKSWVHCHGVFVGHETKES